MRLSKKQRKRSSLKKSNLFQVIWCSQSRFRRKSFNRRFQVREMTWASRKRTIKLDKIFLFHDKLIKKYRDYVKNLTTIFRLISDDFSTKNFKIVYDMQFLTKEIKKTWYRFEKQNLDHEYIFKKYCEHLLNLIENFVNRYLHHAQLFSNAKQEKNNRCKFLTLF
jgi:hypothetical protein